MEYRYLKNVNQHALPDYDEKISKWLKKQETGITSMVSYSIVICNENRFYREIICSGFGEYVQTCEFLYSLNMDNVLEGDQTLKGYDAVFLSLDYIDKVESVEK